MCTAEGELLICESKGEFKMMIEDSPGNKWEIKCITIYTKGFIVGGVDGKMYIYEKGDSIDVPFKLQRIIVQNKDSRNSSAAVTSIGITSSEDVLSLIHI